MLVFKRMSVCLALILMVIASNGFVPAKAAEDAEFNSAQEKASWVVKEYVTDSMTEYEVALTLYEWLVQNVEYDHGYIQTGKPTSEYGVECEGALLGGMAICGGFADAYKLLIETAGMQAEYVHGNALGGAHGWNLVCIENKWYQCDPTWDDEGEIDYFGLTDEAMRVDHDQMNHLDIRCDSYEANYQYRKGTYDDDIERLKKYIEDNMATGIYDGNLASGTSLNRHSWTVAKIVEDIIPENEYGKIAINVKLGGSFEYHFYQPGSDSEYTVSGGMITDYTGNDENLVIPETIQGQRITGIYSYAFQDCETLKNVVLPDGITSIGDFAFLRCTALTGIDIPDTVKTIGAAAFHSCNLLEEVKIPYGISKIERHTFYNCAIKEISLPNELVSIGSAAFSSCKSLLGIEIPDSVTSIGENAFYKCESLCRVVLPDNLSAIPNGLFDGCMSLTTINIPSELKAIGNRAFLRCEQLKDLSLPNGLQTIGNNAFAGCAMLEQVAIPDSVSSIDYNAFGSCSSLREVVLPQTIEKITNSMLTNCTSLESIRIPESVMSIEMSAFSGCTALKAITLPDMITEIGTLAFNGCTNIRDISLPAEIETIKNGAFKNCKSLESISFNNKLTSIDMNAFYGCISLQSAELPQSLISIGAQAFASCTNLKRILIPASVISIDTNAFDDCMNTLIICSAADAYAKTWAETNGFTWEHDQHTEIVDVAVPATHITTGLTAGSHCDVCGEIVLIQEIIPVVAVSINYLPDMLRVIGEEAFSGSGIECVVIAENCEQIDAAAFENCMQLKFIEIPASVTHIDSCAFAGCREDLVIVTSSGSTAEAFAQEMGMYCVIH